MSPQVRSLVDIQPLLDTAGDCFHFVTEFFEVINMSATHIYTSALVLTPQSSIVRKLYDRYVRPSPRVVVGLPESWDPRIASAILSTQLPDVTWSPCSRFVAISTSTGIEIRDSTTLEKLSALESPMSLSSSAVTIAYSPNGRLLACACTRPSSFEVAIAIWDIQTGGIVKAIHGGEPGYPCSMLFSSDGKMLSVACGKRPCRWTVCTFDTASGERGFSDEFGSMFDPVFWTEKDSIRFATSYQDGDNLHTDTWEINPTSNGHPAKIESFCLRHEFDSDNYQMFFSPTSLRVAFVSVRSTVIRDARNSNILLESSASRTLGSYAGHFSPDGSLFACTEHQDVHIWKATPEGYTLWSRFPLRFSTAPGGAFAFSPDMGSVIGWGLGIMEVWKLDHPVDPPLSEMPPDFWNSHLVGFSTDGVHVAIGRASTNIVTVIDLRGGISKLIADADTGIMDVKMVGESVFVLGDVGVVSWDLAAGSHQEEGHGVRRVGLEESLTIVGILDEEYEYALEPRLLDDQCQKVVLTAANDILVFDADTGIRLAEYSSPERFTDFRFSPDGQQLWVTFVHLEGDDSGDEDSEGDNGGSDEGDESEGDASEGDESEGDCQLGVGKEGDVSGLMGGETSEEGLEIVEDEETGEFTLALLPSDTQPPRHPWKSSKGYKIDGVAIQWVLDCDGKRLLWLPPHWRMTDEKMWRWNEDFLLLRKSTFPEPVVIKLSLM